MKFHETELEGVFVLELELLEDERGFFARSWSPEEFAAHGLNPHIAQCNVSFNLRKGTVRGMHFQVAPHAEAKLVRCTRGAIFDVAVDLRPGSPTRYRWTAVELNADNRRLLYVPEGFAHGYQTLEAATEIFYQVSETYYQESARGLRWDDPRLGIGWPLPVSLISERDRAFELL
jgi:dTDP-4-dehydrorhamnose 3,5-epimerase